MFRSSKPCRAVSSFYMFLLDSTGAARYKGLSFYGRAEKLTRDFKRLTRMQRVRLYSRGRKVPVPIPRSQRPRPPRKPTQYNAFVRRQFPKLKGNGRDRIRAAAKLWKAEK